ncbi:MAG: DUF3592 domain-containing protein [Xanthobacteraceae bacterium]
MYFFLTILAAFAGLLVFATVYKYIEVRIAARWSSVPGKILSAKVVQRKAGGTGSDQRHAELRNFAEVTYEYVVQGRRYRASRVSVGEDLGNYRVEETLAKYPAGVPVMVFYNPANPGEALLERDVPEGLFRFMFLLVGGIVAVGLALIFGVERIHGWLHAVLLAKSNASLALMFGFMGVFALLIGRAMSYEAKQAAGWPSTWGVVEESGIEDFQTLEDGRWKTRKRTNVVYRYQVKGNTYRSGRIGVARWNISSNIGALTGVAAKKYPPGRPVEVFFNPANPAEAVLERRATGAGFVYAAGVVLLAVAARVAGLF